MKLKNNTRWRTRRHTRRELLSSLIVLIGCFIFLELSFPSKLSAEEYLLEKIYYYVNDDIITKLDFEEAYGLANRDPALKNLNESNLSNTVISNLITEKVISYYAGLEGIRIRESDIDSEVNRLMQHNNIYDREQFDQVLSTQGISIAVFERQVERNLLIQRYVSRNINVDLPTDDEVLAYYETHKEEEFKVGEPIYYLSWILLKSSSRNTFSERKKIQNRAEEIHEEVAEGELSFKAAVEKYSEDEVSQANGGLLGWKQSEGLPVSAESLAEMKALPLGSITPLYSSETGVFFYKIDDKLTTGYVPYRVATQQIRQSIIKKRREQAFQDTLKQLHQISYIKSNVEKFDIKF